MLGRVIGLFAVVAALSCGGPTVPDDPPAFRGSIGATLEDGRYIVDDGSGTACGVSFVHVTDSTQIRWRLGLRPARRDDLRAGRLISLWTVGDTQARCTTVTARLVLIESPPAP